MKKFRIVKGEGRKYHIEQKSIISWFFVDSANSIEEAENKIDKLFDEPEEGTVIKYVTEKRSNKWLKMKLKINI